MLTAGFLNSRHFKTAGWGKLHTYVSELDFFPFTFLRNGIGWQALWSLSHLGVVHTSSCSIGRSVDPLGDVGLRPVLAHMICVCSFKLVGQGPTQ